MRIKSLSVVVVHVYWEDESIKNCVCDCLRVHYLLFVLDLHLAGPMMQ